ncbi:MAG: ATP-dependent DNA ligase [Candidatus Hydrothermales bacterium]
MKLKEVVILSKRLSEISSIKEKINLLLDFFSKLKKEEFKIAISLLIGKAPYGKLQLGLKSLSNFFSLKEGEDSVELLEIDNILKELSKIKGAGSQRRKLNIVYNLFRKLSQIEREFFLLFIIGEVRQGVSKGILKKAISKFLNIKEEEIDEISLRRGDFLDMVDNLLSLEFETLKEFSFQVFKPFLSMLGVIIHTLEDLPKGSYAVEYKVDGIRIQVHKKGNDVRIFSRNLRDITTNLLEIKEIIKNWNGDFVLDGEAVVFDRENRIIPFQDIISIVARKKREKVSSIKPIFFDIVYKDGEQLFKYKNSERWKILKETVPEDFLIKRIETDKKEEIERFFHQSIEEGNEGIMIKKIDSPYFIGSRKNYWFKLKKVYTLDLVILEAEWGHGRRKNWLSDFLLGCLSRDGKKFLPLGKTFKGLSDSEFEEITKILLTKKIEEKENGIVVKPELVVEVDFSEIVRSPFYESGYALRFARIRRIRSDKDVNDIAKIDDIESIFKEFRRKKGDLV